MALRKDLKEDRAARRMNVDAGRCHVRSWGGPDALLHFGVEICLPSSQNTVVIDVQDVMGSQ
jgi:hypothetical protein